MENTYNVKVNNTFNYKLKQSELDSLDIQNTSTNNFHILQNNHSFEAEIIDIDFSNKKYNVKINGSSYSIDIANELDQLIEKMGLSLGSAQMINHIKAPMPGLILDVNINKGDEVKEGDFLLVLEAMKMENTITAPRDGVVKLVSVKKGEAVKKNQLLIEME